MAQKPKIVVLTGAGMSAESGISTFRDAGGLWEGHDIMEVASPQGWQRNPELVLDFYNKRRRQLHEVAPNEGHLRLAALESAFDVHVITQNVDNLHERAGSTKILHLHGELFKVRSTRNPNHILHWEHDLNWGDTDPQGHQLRPHIVWFGEEVPALAEAVDITTQADAFVVIGTSMQVYPAASLIEYAPLGIPLYYIDPNPADIPFYKNKIDTIAKGGSEGARLLERKLRDTFGL
ncbi:MULTISPECIES: NAD-dependent deacylase [unclassified Flavobacterium]|uniref:SIR2 family NAD-dependent protein deacylase n=1 Tax=unclassified Flavobacterium TaxID=196869 RepID=UPI001F140CA3|nr:MULTISPECIES: NAD-dependent deacylase [unclassified Flavobacterium]UMY65167.1 NAD-dependent deacylase [Flavobacterium sp. HJ-32-4]